MCINIYTLIKSTCCKSFMTTSLLFFNAFQICGKIPWFFCWLPFAWLTERLITIDRLTTRWPWINFYKSQNLTTTNKKNTDIKNNNLSLIKCSFYYKSSRGRNSAYCIMWYVSRSQTWRQVLFCCWLFSWSQNWKVDSGHIFFLCPNLLFEIMHVFMTSRLNL